MALRSISSTDGKTWSAPDGPGNPIFQGPQLTVFRGELWGAWIATQEGSEFVPYLYKYVDGKMPAAGGSIAPNPKWRTVGRLSSTELDDKYYLAYRGATSGKYWVAISPTPGVEGSFKLANPGGVDRLFAYSPTICSFQGSLVLLGVDEDNQIHFQVMSSAGTIERAWTAIPNQKTIRAPGLAVYQNALYLVHAAENGNESWYGKLTDKTGSWSSFGALASKGISSSVSLAVHSDGKLYTSWTNTEGTMYLFTFDGASWTNAAINTSAKAEGSSGIGSLGGKLYVAYGQKSTTSTASSRYFDGEGVPIWSDGNDSDDEVDEVYYEKQEAMQAYRPKWLAPSSSSGMSPESSKTWLSKFFCL